MFAELQALHLQEGKGKCRGGITNVTKSTKVNTILVMPVLEMNFCKTGRCAGNMKHQTGLGQWHYGVDSCFTESDLPAFATTS